MDENPRLPRKIAAPPAEGTGAAIRLPGAGGSDRRDWPPVDEHLVEPETSRDEVVRGRVVQALPARSPHADRHFEIDYVIRAHLSPGWIGATELLTRVAEHSDFATDTCIRRQGTDPATGRRYLEEVAFEVVNEQRQGDITERAEDLSTRGVRRVFAIFVKKGEVCVWSRRWSRWRRLAPESEIRDECLAQPLPVKALLDAAEADNAVVQALVAKKNPAIRQLQQRKRAEGQTEILLTVLTARGLELDAATRERISRCRDSETIRRWAARAAAADSVADVLADD